MGVCEAAVAVAAAAGTGGCEAVVAVAAAAALVLLLLLVPGACEAGVAVAAPAELGACEAAAEAASGFAFCSALAGGLVATNTGDDGLFGVWEETGSPPNMPLLGPPKMLPVAPLKDLALGVAGRPPNIPNVLAVGTAAVPWNAGKPKLCVRLASPNFTNMNLPEYK